MGPLNNWNNYLEKLLTRNNGVKDMIHYGDNHKVYKSRIFLPFKFFER